MRVSRSTTLYCTVLASVRTTRRVISPRYLSNHTSCHFVVWEIMFPFLHISLIFLLKYLIILRNRAIVLFYIVWVTCKFRDVLFKSCRYFLQVFVKVWMFITLYSTVHTVCSEVWQRRGVGRDLMRRLYRSCAGPRPPHAAAPRCHISTRMQAFTGTRPN